MKYIDAEKLKKYLTDRYEVCPINDDERHGRHCAIIEIENFIDSLQQEQQAVEGVVHHVVGAHYIETNQVQLNARLREIPEGTKVNILICEAEEEGK